MRFLLFATCLLLTNLNSFAQGCCSGGSGSPIAGGTSQGVLAFKQVEVGMSNQYINTNKFMTGERDTSNYLKDFNTDYLYTRLAYGVTERLTFSVESGYFFNKTQVPIPDTGKNAQKKDNLTSKGIADLILFPRYKIYEHNTEKTRNEITLGLGLKMSIGDYFDSTYLRTNAAGKKFYTPLPPAVMPTTGSNDFIFYGFAFRGYPEKKFRMFANVVYIKKGWNALGEKFGDYASVGIFASKTVLRKLGITVQLKGEWIDVMDYDKKINYLATYNIDVKSFGSKKIAIAPQISYSIKQFAFYALSEYPIYQYVNGTAIASQYLFTLGASYRFLLTKNNE